MSSDAQQTNFFGAERGGKRARLSGVPHNGTDTSRAAAARTHALSDRERVYGAVLLMKERGMTCDEVEVKLGLSHQTASARIRGLVTDRVLVDSGARRATRTGSSARVYVHADHAKGQA